MLKALTTSNPVIFWRNDAFELLVLNFIKEQGMWNTLQLLNLEFDHLHQGSTGSSSCSRRVEQPYFHVFFVCFLKICAKDS